MALPLSKLRGPDLPHTIVGARQRFTVWIGLIVILALLVREYFVLVAVVDFPIRGDIREYVDYAWNLRHYGVFSMLAPGATTPLPDAYRSPGYPWLLALCMWLRPYGDGWYQLALQFQVFLGTATVWLTMLVGRRWLTSGWPLAAGVLLAIWPHHIAATGALLSEVLFGCTLMAALYALSLGLSDCSRTKLALAGATFGLAYLINPVIALFPPVVALLIWRSTYRPGVAGLFLVIFLVPVLAFAARNAHLQVNQPSAQHLSRSAINLAQGAAPEYHHAWHAQALGDPGGAAIIKQIDQDARLLDSDPLGGLGSIASRVKSYPAYFATWYLWQKPVLLWSWDIQMGPGGIYVLKVRNSPLQTHPLLRSTTATLRLLNPVITFLAFIGTLLLLTSRLRRTAEKPPLIAVMTAALAVYLTAVHSVFQAEPRYAIAYRGIELILLVSCLHIGWLAIRARLIPQTDEIRHSSHMK